MRVEMCRWVLLCICVGWSLGGGGCSARALLQMELVDKQMALDEGRAVIDVRGEKDSVRMVGGEGQPQILIDPLHPRRIGIYLDGVSGQVAVVVDVYRGLCRIGGGRDRGNVSVTPGKETQFYPIDLTPTPGATCMASVTTADAGAEAAVSTTSDAACDEGGTDAPGAPTCEEFCAVATVSCPDTYPAAGCLDTCVSAGWPAGNRNTPTGEDTIGCRLIHANAAARDNPTECPNAAPDSAVCRATR
jgi:hypothetical protein